MAKSMHVRLPMEQGHAFLGGRGSAHSARLKAQRLLTEDPRVIVVFDFAGVTGLSHRYADELLTPVYETLGPLFSQRVIFENCTPAVREAFDLVCSMHRLPRPRYARATESGRLVRVG